MLFVREDISSKLLSTENAPTEGFYIKLNLRKKWLLWGSCNPHRNTITNHFDPLTRRVALFSSTYENYIVIGDFSLEVEDAIMSNFSKMFDQTTIMVTIFWNFTMF